MKVLVTAACAPPGRNTFIAISKVLNPSSVYASDCNEDHLYLLYDSLHSFSLPSADSFDYIKTLINRCEFYGIKYVVPCIEEEVSKISSSIDLLEAAGISCLVPYSKALESLTNKRFLYDTAKSLNLSTPLTLYAREFIEKYPNIHSDSVEDSKSVFWLIKPVKGHGMRGVRYLEGLDNLKKQVARYSGLDYVVQKGIISTAGDVYMIGCLFDKNSCCRRTFASRSTETLYSHGGPATAGVSVHCPSLVEQTKLLLSHVGWIGPAGVEWIREQHSGRFYVIDVNPRMWGYSSLLNASGSDFIPALLTLLKGGDLEPDPGYKVGVQMLRTFLDVFSQ